jgi:hypothetical protein
MADEPNYKEIALASVGRGFWVLALEGKSPQNTHGKGWKEAATSDPSVVEGWDFPNATAAGVYCRTEEYWALDVDHMPWFMENCPCPPQTFHVITGLKCGEEWQDSPLWMTRGRHYYFKGKVPVGVAAKFPNPRRGEPGQPDNLMERPEQVVAAGSPHKSGVLYEAVDKFPLADASSEFVSWLRKMSVKGNGQLADSFPAVKADWEPKAELEKAGLKFEVRVRGELEYLNYHTLYGKCLACDRLHDGHANNNEQCAFVWEEKGRQLFHKCHVSGAGPAKGPLSKLGIDWASITEKPSQEYRVKITSSPVSKVKDEPIEWAPGLEGYVPRKMTTMLNAPKGVGKTKLSNYWTARVNAAGFRVIRFNLEDPGPQVLKPSLFKAGANLDLVEIVDRYATASKDGKEMKTAIDFSRPEFTEALVEYIESFGDVALVVIEPINNYKGKAKAVSEDDMRPIHSALFDAAERTGVGILIINHTNRRKDTSDPLEKAHGAGSGQNVARVNWMLDRDNADKDVRLLMDAGSNLSLGKNLALKIVGDGPFTLGDVEHKDIAHMVLVGNTDRTAQEHIEEKESVKQTATVTMADWIEELLKENGEMDAKSVQAQAGRENPDWTPANVRQVFKRKLAEQGKAYSDRVGKKTMWGLGKEPPERQRDFVEERQQTKKQQQDTKESGNDY